MNDSVNMIYRHSSSVLSRFYSSLTTFPSMKRFQTINSFNAKELLYEAMTSRNDMFCNLSSKERSLRTTRGFYYFNLFRLRQEFGNLFEWNSSSIASLKSQSRNRKSNHNNILSSVVSSSIQSIDSSMLSFSSIKGLFLSLFNIFFQQNQFNTTTQYSSINKDISILESPEFEVSIARKLYTVNRMRVSYKCLSANN